MATREENVKKILSEYELLRAEKEVERDKRVEKIYSEYPRLKAILEEINTLGFENAKKIMEEPQNAEKFNNEFNKKLLKLKKEEEEIIEKNGIDKDFNSPRYDCTKCEDTGYIGNERCECFKRKLIKKAYSQSNLSSILDEQGFEDFSLEYYSDKLKQDEKLSDRENMKNIFDVCVSFCKNFDETKKSILMIGKPGLGKTFLSNSIAKELLNRGKSVVYIRATSLFSAYEDYRFGRDEKFDQERLYDCDLLIIDDLGTENITKSGVSFFFDLLNERIDRGRKIIINSNFTMSEISKTYSARITSRIYEFFKVLEFKGEDIRIKKLKRNKK